MTNKLLKKYSIDIFFIFIGILLIISIIEAANIIDIAYLGCVIYYYVRIRICRLEKYQ